MSCLEKDSQGVRELVPPKGEHALDPFKPRPGRIAECIFLVARFLQIVLWESLGRIGQM